MSSNPKDTSREAWESVRPHMHKIMDEVLALVEGAGPNGVANHEIAHHFAGRWCYSAPQQAMRMLVLAGKVKDSGMRRTTARKREAIVWVTGQGEDRVKKSQVILLFSSQEQAESVAAHLRATYEYEVKVKHPSLSTTALTYQKTRER